jgi:hypothetical protein
LIAVAGRYSRLVAEGGVTDEVARRWLDGYMQAWRSNDRAEIEALFSADAAYRPQPDTPPAVGPSAIADAWLDDPDPPGSWNSELTPMLVHDDTAIITGWTDYADGERYLNLWIVRFAADGRCADFTEWWMNRRQR